MADLPPSGDATENLSSSSSPPPSLPPPSRLSPSAEEVTEKEEKPTVSKSEEPKEEKEVKEVPLTSSGSVAEEKSTFECNICFETASEPVVTPCGHLYCWPCLYRWFEALRAEEGDCPVCKSGINKRTLIPLYGRGRDSTDPRTKTPSRPVARRTAAPRRTGFRSGAYDGPGPFGMGGGGGGGGWSFNVGIGGPLFPLGFATYRFGDHGHQNNAEGEGGEQGPVEGPQSSLSQIMLVMGVFVVLWILMLPTY